MKLPQILHELSGGKDSAYALFLLIQSGYKPITLFIRMFPKNDAEDRARAISRKFGLSMRVLDLTEKFKEKVVNYFISEYRSGRTPNPCVVCNREIKFGDEVLKTKEKVGAKLISTGHYAKADGGRLFEGKSIGHSQAYFLSMVKKEAISVSTFPLEGSSPKSSHLWFEREFGKIPRPTRDICFLSGKNYRQFLDGIFGKELSGPIYDSSGKLLGYHRGIHHFTVGQRKGLGGGFGKRLFVVKIDPKEMAVYVGERSELLMKFVEARSFSWIEKPKRSLLCQARVRYRAKRRKVKVVPKEGKVVFEFLEPQEAPAPGQVIVPNTNSMILGGGFIERAWK